MPTPSRPTITNTRPGETSASPAQTTSPETQQRIRRRPLAQALRIRRRAALRSGRRKTAAAWSRLGDAAQWLATAAITLAMRVLWVDPTFDDVEHARYTMKSARATHREVATSKVDADALLAFAQAVAAETDDSIKSGRDKTRTLITLTAFFLTALAFIVRDGTPHAFWTSIAFGGVAVAALLLHRSLRVTWHNRLVLTASDLKTEDADAFKRSHAADLLFNANRNDGVVAFIVDVHRAAMRALLIALAATLIAALWPSVADERDGSPSPTEATTIGPVPAPAPPTPAGDASRPETPTTARPALDAQAPASEPAGDQAVADSVTADTARTDAEPDSPSDALPTLR